MTGKSEEVLSPAVLWAQRKNLVYLNVLVDDCKDPTIEMKKEQLIFKGVGGTDKKRYELDLDLFGPIKPEDSKFKVRGRGTEFVLIKEDASSPFWKRLLKSDKKYHWLKVDFDKWKDEDESDEEAGGAGGMPGMGGMGGMGMGGMGDGGNFEELMRNMGGMGGGGAGMPDMDDLDKDSDDDGLPDLEG